MTANELLTEVKTDLQQYASDKFSDTQLLSLLNEGYRDIMRVTEIVEKSATTTITALDSVIGMPSDFLESRQVRWSYNRVLYPQEPRKSSFTSTTTKSG
jgi:hypothetical protein